MRKYLSAVHGETGSKEIGSYKPVAVGHCLTSVSFIHYADKRPVMVSVECSNPDTAASVATFLGKVKARGEEVTIYGSGFRVSRIASSERSFPVD